MAVSPDAVRLLWGQRAAPKRGPKPGLSLAAISRAAVEIADAEGLAAATMQRVADALGVTKMALYRYVPGKVELVALMVDLGVGTPPSPSEGAGWRPRLHAWTLALFERFYRHPWALEATVGARPIGPNELSWLEQAVSALLGTGLTGAEQIDVAATLAGHARAIATQAAAAPAGAPEQAMTSGMTQLLRGHEDRFPALLTALESSIAESGQDNALEFGLARILDGVELLIASRAGESGQRTGR